MRGIELPPTREGNIYVSFPIFHPRREALARALGARGVDVDLGFMCDCAALPLFASAAADCPQSRRAADQIVHLPVHPLLASGDLEQIASAVEAAAGELA